jgi:hypothetical protein
MNVKKILESRIKGWFPKEPNQPHTKVKLAEEPTKAFKVLWYVVVIAILTLIMVGLSCSTYLLF